jgi:hypothetical protein
VPELLLVAQALAVAQVVPVALSVTAAVDVDARLAREPCEATAWALGRESAEGDA